MILQEISNTLILLCNHKLVKLSFILIIFISLLISIFFSIFSSITIILGYLCGCIVSFCLIKYRFQVNILLERFINIFHSRITNNKFLKSCTICDKINCNRHQNENLKDPSKGLLINEELNEVLEKFYNKILETFVSSWYKNLSEDASFINELRLSLRFATSSMLLRVLNINLGNLITNKLLPCTIQHINDCINIQEQAKKNNISLDSAAILYLERKIHVAVTNRENELEYLRQFTTAVLPKISSKSNNKCTNFNTIIREIISGWVLLPLMDVISDPNIINLLVNIAMKHKKKQLNPKKATDRKVEILNNFADYSNVKNVALGLELTKILKSPEWLYSFMQFLKEYGPVNILQFCLDVEEFNKKLLTPELSKNDLQDLYKEATKIFDIYLRENSSDFIGTPKEINSHFEFLLQGGPTDIPKLRTSTPLFKAYDFAFNTLENRWLSIFFHSDEFYKLACGSKVSSKYQKSPRNRFNLQMQGSPYKNRSNKKNIDLPTQGAVSKISSSFNKIKSSLRAQPVEGSVCHSEQSFEPEPVMFIERNTNRDLSTWRISITNAEHVSSSKPISVFFVNVKRVDACLESERYWTVKRQDQDFYTLKIKLVEFHGENEICDSPLPPRRLTTPTEVRRKKYEEFLQRLLQKPTLRGSDLLYTFLTTKENFTLLADTSVPIVSDLENIYQSVAHKFRKEKGQRLDSFMTTFLMSTETGQSKTNKFENPDVGEEAGLGVLLEKAFHKPRDLKNSIFKNNFGISLKDISDSSPAILYCNDFIECSFYLLKNIFRAPKGVLQFFGAICSISSQALNSLACFFIEKEIKSSLSEQNLAHLILLLQDSLFGPKSEPLTSIELEQRKQTAFNHFTTLNRGFFCYWTGLEINEGLKTLLQILQHPQLNKQLAYSLLDIIILELFPDCNLTEL